MDKRIILKEEADVAVSEIIKKYNFTETLQQAVEKINKGELPKESILVRFVLEFTASKKSDQESISTLEQKLTISKEAAESLLKDIKEKLVPLTIIVEIEDDNGQQTDTNSSKPIQDNISNGNDLGIKVEKTILQKKTQITPPLVKTGNTKNIKNPIKKTEIKKTDSYREPIE